MFAIFAAAAVTCFVALFIGQAALRLAGARRWSWLAPPVGLAVTMMVATPAIEVPGRCATVAAFIALLALAAAVWCLRSPDHRPPLAGLLAAVPVAILTAVPFLSAGRGGILGVTVNNDMAVHLLFVESYLSAEVAAVSPLPKDYPMGPHAVSALLAKGLEIEAETAFSAWTMAIPIVSAWTVQVVARNASWFGRAIAATVAGLPFLVAAYYGQGAFKEIVQAALVLAAALSLSGYEPRLALGRWVPFALLVGGIVSAFSLAGLPWPAAFFALWLAGGLAIAARRRRLSGLAAAAMRELPAIGVGLGVLVLGLLPQAERMRQFLLLRDGTGISVDDIGNLVGPLPGWEALGAWDNPDFRLPASPAYEGGAWSLFMLALVFFGVVWAFRRGRWPLPLCAAAAIGIWALSDRSQSPYVTAKALVVASPLLLILAALPLVDGPPDRRRLLPWLAVMSLGLVLVARVGKSDLLTLRWSPVGPTDHARQVEAFRPLLAGEKTLYLGGDEFIRWQLSGVPVHAAALVGIPQVPMRRQKGWQEGKALDFDAVHAPTLNRFDWFITPRDPAGSFPPAQLRLIRETDDFQLWRRVGSVPERSVLAEGEWPGAVLECDTREGRHVAASGGVASVRRLTVVAPLPTLGPGQSVSVHLDLRPGRWILQMPYTSHLPVTVTAPGARLELPANLDRIGPRWPVGQVRVRGDRGITLTFRVGDTILAPASHVAALRFLVATPAPRRERLVPVARACGEYVDWYRSTSG